MNQEMCFYEFYPDGVRYAEEADLLYDVEVAFVLLEMSVLNCSVLLFLFFPTKCHVHNTIDNSVMRLQQQRWFSSL